MPPVCLPLTSLFLRYPLLFALPPGQYWHDYDDHCTFFKQHKVGWFWHTWSREGVFDVVADNGGYVIPAFKAKRC
jgi:hypothetical protein